MAYAAVISLKYTIEYLRYPKFITRSAYDELELLGNTLKRLDGSSNRSINRSAINALDAEIREAVCKLEDALLSYYLLRRYFLPLGSKLDGKALRRAMASPSYSTSEEDDDVSSTEPLLLEEDDDVSPTIEVEVLKREIYSFPMTVWKLRVMYLRELNNPQPVQEEEDDSVPPIHDFDGKLSTTVGLLDQFDRIRNELLNSEAGPKVVALVGMAGIGKTHLARQIYHHPLMAERFDLTVWVSVGPQQQLKNVWAETVALVEGRARNVYKETNIITLVGLLQKSLRGRGRCLIILDDIWSTKVCECLIRYLLSDGDGNRILLTTRLEEVAKYYGTTIHQIRFLDKEESWKLLQQIVFGEGTYFPRQLEKAGRKIAENCEGLPLLILAVADILCEHDKTEEYWNKVADSKTTTFTDAYEKIEKVLFSSYEYLPQYLRGCFLYMGVFPQKSEIPLPKLLNLWIVDDVLEPQTSMSESVSLPECEPFETLETNPSVKPIRSKTRVPLFEISTPFETSSSEIDPFMERMQSETENFNWTSKRNRFKTCRYETRMPLEGLYLLEPGPSPIPFIKPWRKIRTWDSRVSLNRRLWFPTRKLPLPLPLPQKVKATTKGIAMECLKKLVSSSLAIVCKQSSNNKIKSCKLHSAYWYLCVKEARKNRFFHVLKKLTDASNDYIERQRRLSVQNNMLFAIKEVYDLMVETSTTRSLLCTGPDQEYPVPLCLDLMLLKVVDALAIRLYDFPTEVLKLLELRYLALTHNGNLPSSISKLQQLQYLIVGQHHNIKVLRNPTRLPEHMRHKIRCMQEAWSTNLRGDSTFSAKDIWEKICDVQAVWGSRLNEYPAHLTREIWMQIWELIWDMQEVKETASLMRNTYYSARLVLDMKKLWSTELLSDLTCFPEEIWVNIWGEMWDMHEVCRTTLQIDSISLLKEIWEEIWDMQEVRSTKLLSDSIFLPKEIWNMRALRHLRIIGRNLPDPITGAKLPNLSSLHVNAHSCTSRVFKSIILLKKLGIRIELQPDSAETSSCFKYIGLLKRLKSLKCVVVNPWLRPEVVAPPHHLSNLPMSLKKLSLNGLGYSWERMSVIGSLPELQVLKLRCSAFQGPEWEAKVEEFPRLKFLLLEDIDLVQWTVASDCCFPSLHRLIIRHCYKLKEVPGAITTMNTVEVEVVDCSPSVVKQINEDRKSFLGVVITSSWSLRR